MERQWTPKRPSELPSSRHTALEILDQVAARAVTRVTITKRGRPVAMLVPPHDEQDAVRRIHGFLRGSVVLPKGSGFDRSDTGRTIRCSIRSIASMTEAPGGVLLDTCAVIWLANGDRLRHPATEAIIAAGLSSGIFVSPISAWEVGLLARPSGRNSPPSEFLPTPRHGSRE